MKPIFKTLMMLVMCLTLFGAIAGGGYYLKVGLENDVIIHRAISLNANNDTPNIINNNFYKPTTQSVNGTTEPCDEPMADLKLMEPVYRGIPINLTLEFEGCITEWGHYDFESEQWLMFNNTADSSIIFRHGIVYNVAWVAFYLGGDRIDGQLSVHVKNFAPSIAESKIPQWWVTYHEENIFESKYTLYDSWYITSAEAWSNRDFSLAMFQVWWETGYQYPGWDWSAGNAVVVHILSASNNTNWRDSGLLWGGHMEVWLYKVPTAPTPPVFGCQQSYRETSYWLGAMGTTPLAGAGFGWMSKPLGCGFDLWIPGETHMAIIYEYDGVILEGCTPWYGDQGWGCLYDEVDYYADFVLG